MKRIPQNQITSNTPFQPLELVLAKVQHTRSGEGYSFKCPAHDDKRNSAYLKADAKGNVILKCFAGCSRKAICEALGLSESDLYVQKAASYSASQTIARYRYYDEAGRLLYEHQRLIAGDGKKTFLYCRTDATGNHLWTLYGGWFELKGRTWKRIEGASDPDNKPKPSARWFDESRRVLYRLSALRKAAPGSLVLYCEGEKDVENAEAMGFVATTAGSASDWRTEFADALQGFDLVIIPDNDEAGYKCAAKVARDCYGKAARVRIVELPGLAEHGDLSDWIKTGGSKEQLLALIEAEKGSESCGTKVAETGHPLPPIVTPEIDLSGLGEIVDDDPPISEDPKCEMYLRQLARNAAKVIEACSLILQLLGFEKDHTRLLSALITIGGDRLNYFQAYHASIRERYAASREASSLETVKRDIKKFREEQASLGIVLLSYKPGFMNLATGQSYPCRFQNRLLRYALEAINISIDDRDDFQTGRKALEAACQIVVESLARTEPVLPKEKKPKAPQVEDLEAKYLEAEKRLIDSMVSDGWAIEEIEEEFERLASFRNRRFQEAERYKKPDASATDADAIADEEDTYFE